MQDCSPPIAKPHVGKRILKFLKPALLLAVVLPGCQTAAERRIAEGESKLREMNARSQMAQSTPTLQSTRDLSPINQTSQNDKHEKSLGMTLYPGSKPYTEGPTTLSNTGDGIAMLLLETQDSVDKVMDFYKNQLSVKLGAGSADKVSFKEENRNGKRTLRLTKPFPSGGLQSVEAKEEDGKTIIELMNLQSITLGKTLPIPESGAGRQFTPPRSQ